MNEVTVGITGMAGFVGSHLRERLAREENVVVPPFEREFFDEPKVLTEYVAQCDSIVHLAAMNRGEDQEIYQTNVELVNKLISAMDAASVKPNIIFSSSTQIDRDNPYGRSKAEGGRLFGAWARRSGASLSVMVIPNVFGDGGRPFYNSVVATFCHQITHGQEPTIIVDGEFGLIYVNELVELLAQKALHPANQVETVPVPPTAQVKASHIRNLLQSFKEHYFDKNTVPAFANEFERNLYNTFITYLDSADFAQRAVLHSDDRGSLFEVVKQADAGQVFFSTTKPGITRGNHYHTRKMEKFCVVRGEAVIRLRRIGTDKVIEYRVSGDKPTSVEMPIFYTHNITNVGDTELLTLFWTNELFDPDNPDTIYQEV